MKGLRKQNAKIMWLEISHTKYCVKYLLAFCLLVVGCSKSNEESLAIDNGSGPNNCDTVNIRYAANIQPIIQANCYGCHGNGRSDAGVSVDTHARLRTLAVGGALVGVVSHAAGYIPMPRNTSKLSECDINKIKSWVLAGAQNN